MSESCIKGKLPEEIRNNCNLRKYMVIPEGFADRVYAECLFERKPDERDYVDEEGIPYYFGEWIDRTPIVKAKLEVYLAEKKLQECENEDKHYRTTLDSTVGSTLYNAIRQGTI